MVYGPCKCGFPSTYKCQECGARLCNNCKPAHICKSEEIPAMLDAPAPVLEYKRKPGRPHTKK